MVVALLDVFPAFGGWCLCGEQGFCRRVKRGVVVGDQAITAAEDTLLMYPGVPHDLTSNISL